MKVKSCICGLALSVLLIGCSPKSIENYEDNANKFIGKGKYQEASITLKAGISEYPNSPSLRELLANTLLDVGDVAGATHSYEVALGLSYSDAVAVNLFELYRFQEKNQSLIAMYQELQKTRSPKNLTLKLLYSISLFKERKSQQALSVFDEIQLESTPGSFENLIASAFSSWVNKSVDSALEKFREAQNLKPKNYDAALGFATLAITTNKFKEAAQALERFAKHREPGNLSRILLAYSYLNLDNVEKAKKQIQILNERAPNALPVLVVDSMYNFMREQFEQSKITSEKALGIAPSNQIARKIAVISNYRLGNYEQAYNYLLPLLSKKDELSNSAINIALELKSKMGLFDEDFDHYLSKLSSIDDSKYDIYTDIALNAFSARRFDLSSKLTHKLSRVSASDVDSQTAQKLTILQSNFDQTSAIELARSTYESDSSFNNLSILSKLLARNNKVEEAFEYINLSGQPASSLSILELKLELLAMVGNGAKVKEMAEQIYAKDQTNVIATSYFLSQAVARKDLDAVVAHCKTLHKNTDTPMSLVYMCFKYLNDNNSEDSVLFSKKIENSYQNDSSNVEYLKFYIHVLIERIDLVKIRSLLTTQVLSSHNEDSLWQTKIDTLAILGEVQEIENTLKYWIAMNPNSRNAWFKKVTFLETTGKTREALQTISDYEEKFGHSDFTGVLKVHFLLKDNNPKEALRQFDNLGDSIEETAPWFGLKGRIFLAKHQYDLAIASLKSAYDITPSPRTVGGLIAAYLAKGDYNSLESFLLSHIHQVPLDYKSRAVLISYYLQTTQEKAIPFLEMNIQQDPSDLDSINNYIWLLNEQGESAKALNMSEPLLAATKKPAHLHTVATVLIKNGKIEAAEKAFQKMMNYEPTNELKYSYLKFLNDYEMKADLQNQIKQEIFNTDNETLKNQVRELLIK